MIVIIIINLQLPVGKAMHEVVTNCLSCPASLRHAEDVRHGQKVINELITCSMFLLEIQPDANSLMYPSSSSFIILISSLNSK